MYYRSGTATGQTPRVHPPGGSTFACDVKSTIRQRQSMHIYTKNTRPAKFHPDPIWNDVALGLFEEVVGRPNKKKNNNKNTMSSGIWDQFLIWI